jgi:hypothetical protein
MCRAKAPLKGRLRSILYRAEIGRSGSTAVDFTVECEWLRRWKAALRLDTSEWRGCAE